MDIYYINLDHENDRLTYIKDQLEKNKIIAERYPGIYGRNINIRMINELIKSNILIENNKWNEFHYNKAILAIYLTHINLWKKILATTKNNYSLILEDDVIIHPNLNEEINKNIKNVPDDWDILYIGRSSKLDGIEIHKNVIKPSSKHIPMTNHGMFAYLIKSTSLSKLICLLTPLEFDNFDNIDWVLRSMYNTKIQAYYLINPIIKHNYGIQSIKDKK